ncbi:polyhydroxyalkanoate synthesis repressor PhaR [Rubrivivax gelatinosus]|nr:polyhydroxyalkanoate synthesis repressor PhaR [Rubrivivax gelatinosus]
MNATRRASASTQAGEPKAATRTLKKYPNRRLYDTRSSSYITLADVKAMVMAGEDFEVRDAKTGSDLTRSILLQIILEEESGGVPMFSTAMLEQIIRFYGHAMQGMMGTMLEKNLQAFVEMQARLVGGQPPAFENLMGAYVDQSRCIWEALQQQMEQAGAMFPGLQLPKR